MLRKLVIYGSVLLIATALIGGAEAGCGCSAGRSSSWSGSDWIDSTPGGSSPEPLPSNGSASEAVDEVIPAEKSGGDENAEIGFSFVSAEELGEKLGIEPKPVIAYVSNSPPSGGSYIGGSISLPSKGFIQADGSLKSVDELAGVLGWAGITAEDEVVLYGDCFSCGDLTFVYWIMKYLGHQKVEILRGPTAELPTAGSVATRHTVKYYPDPHIELLADYESVASGQFVVVDARTPDQFGEGHIDGALNIEFNRVIDDSWIKDDSALAEIFADIDPDRPVAVYSKNGGTASIIWYALTLQGRDVKLYTWNDWVIHK
ncbi:sulfurtransferase [Methanothrix harundinacea]|uniref:sulfurtransferase n=1 Tax=Methanothrix harundinacea TaxID=301375 RepID=UPI0009D95133|nr:rhodanese-like domain-containing protein [Methanothrix harundinacea]